ncbi:uncharacterized protein MELLADRAFT_116435 [Melampsora larici-populina 98AG31]|uniref:Uncharacterized protein n=1 Tax=Melampsora larici-populina (strain 98AG31 / pathotype 3-4-7) TaxID=747676 RepID=F4RL44_MELLP|nr:uncharacterized protein MELLADRAFT_116435 [Melampsora larici-populina 98AG31]EGG06841.1 hypothetical protein MELLADRAFT_116435 [Melampsora larici-populina 98AG31]
MTLQQHHSQTNMISSTPTPSPQDPFQTPHLHCYNPTSTPTRFRPTPTKQFYFKIHTQRLYSKKVHPKTANSIGMANPNQRLLLTASAKHTYRPSRIEGGIEVVKRLYQIPSPIPLSEIPDLRVTEEEPLSDPFAALMAAVNYASSFETSLQVTPAVLVPESPDTTTTPNSCHKRKVSESSIEPPSSKRQKGKTVGATTHQILRLRGSLDRVQTRSMTRKLLEEGV